METVVVLIGFFAAAFVAAVAAMVLCFVNAAMWSVALSVVAVLFAVVAMIFTLSGQKQKTEK